MTNPDPTWATTDILTKLAAPDLGLRAAARILGGRWNPEVMLPDHLTHVTRHDLVGHAADAASAAHKLALESLLALIMPEHSSTRNWLLAQPSGDAFIEVPTIPRAGSVERSTAIAYLKAVVMSVWPGAVADLARDDPRSVHATNRAWRGDGEPLRALAQARDPFLETGPRDGDPNPS